MSKVSKKDYAPKSFNFTFTWNNYPEDFHDILTSLRAEYIGWSHEVAPTTGTAHLQGFVCFPCRRQLSAVRKAMGGMHVEVMAGHILQNEDYCGKKEVLFFIGVPPKAPGAGEKDRWKAARAAAEAGKLDEIPDDIYMRLYSTIKKIATDHLPTPPDNDVLENVWICGPTGCGKSRGVRALYPDAYNKDPKTRWWDGYKGQETVIIDDLDVFDKSCGGDLKRWIDHYAFPAQLKGSSIMIRPKRVIVTSQYTMEEIWDDAKTLEALNRRFKIDNRYPAPSQYASIFGPPK